MDFDILRNIECEFLCFKHDFVLFCLFLPQWSPRFWATLASSIFDFNEKTHVHFCVAQVECLPFFVAHFAEARMCHSQGFALLPLD